MIHVTFEAVNLLKKLKQSRWLRRSLRIAGATVFVLIVSVFYAGHILTRASPRPAGETPNAIPCEAVSFASPSGATISGWFAPGLLGRGCVLLMHGVRGSRHQMLPRAVWLNELGYSVLLFDFQAHGESTGTRITCGLKESQDAVAALEFLKSKRPGEKVAAIGVSLGGAATLLGERPLAVDAVILESVYTTIDAAIENRLRMRVGFLAPVLKPLMLWQSDLFAGVSTRQLRPIERIHEVSVPVFVIHGTEDKHTTLDEAQRLFEQACEPKEFWPVNEAAHVDLFDSSPNEYRRRVGEFLERHLGTHY